MRTSKVFWGGALVILGGLLLLKSLNIITWNVWLIFWPAILILAGVWMLFGPAFRRHDMTSEAVSIPLQGAAQAVLDINHGAGVLRIGAGAAVGNLLDGNFVGGVEHRADYSGQWVSATISPPPNIIFGIPDSFGSEGLRWDLRLTDRVPLDIRLHTGAGESRVDFSALNVQKLTLETGASSSNITLPGAAGLTNVEVRAGAASVVLRVPQGVAGRIRMKSGLLGIKVDNSRFPFNGSTYETPGFDGSQNRVEINVEAGVGSIEILSA